MARTKGALNIRTQETMNRVQLLCLEMDLDVFAVMIDIVKSGKFKGVRKRLPPDQRLMILKELTQYAYPKLAAMKHTLDLGDDNHLTIEWEQPNLFDDDDGDGVEIEGEVINH